MVTPPFSVTAEDQMEKAAQSVTQAPSSTTQPELVGAEVVKTITPSNAYGSGTNQAGTYVRYTFDETIDALQSGAAAKFNVYTTEATRRWTVTTPGSRTLASPCSCVSAP